MDRHQLRLHLRPEGPDLPDRLQELLHQLIPLVFQQLVAPLGGAQLAFQAGELHSGGAYRDIRHGSPLLTARLSSASISQSAQV